MKGSAGLEQIPINVVLGALHGLLMLHMLPPRCTFRSYMYLGTLRIKNLPVQGSNWNLNPTVIKRLN
jgi:hypothetical protein